MRKRIYLCLAHMSEMRIAYPESFWYEVRIKSKD